MQVQLPAPVLWIMQQLRQAGYEAYMVGGAIRDILLVSHGMEMNTVPYDFDLTTNARPDQIQALFPESFYENTFGTVSLTLEHITTMSGKNVAVPAPTAPPETDKQSVISVMAATKLHSSLSTALQDLHAEHYQQPSFQITTFRSDGAYEDHRHPTSVTWGKTLEEDVARRDFTINALALEISDSFLSNWEANPDQAEVTISDREYHVHDYHHGMHDMTQQTLKTVGDPKQRFQEDALRLLRAVRFSVQLNFVISDETFDAILDQAHLIQNISGERIRDELLKILSSHYPAEGIELLDTTGLLQWILPELLEGKGVTQGGHHTTDVWTHSLDALRTCPSKDPIVRLATLLHDVAKPRTRREAGNAITFYNHEIVGSRMVKQIAARLRLSKSDTERLFVLVRHHMFHYQPSQTDAAIRRFMRKVGLTNIDDILDLREGDRLGSGARKTSWRLEEMKERMIEQLHQPMEVTDLAIGGTEIMTQLQLKPGPIIGKILNHLFELVLENPELNTPEKLLSEAAAFYAENK